ncbi:hypothetical protein [Cohnella candidum]|uniref:hypothetical protein n=1 Tax=Cohnella candidum TaxID=2674991 RepID=UPI0013DDA992|nr:hypothetical protein [Cohnella candidum]
MFSMHNPHEHHQHRSSHHVLGQARQLVGRNVIINRGSPDSVQGTLLAVIGDVLVLDSMGFIIFVDVRHVRSITGGTSRGSSGSQGHDRHPGRSGQAPISSGNRSHPNGNRSHSNGNRSHSNGNRSHSSGKRRRDRSGS